MPNEGFLQRWSRLKADPASAEPPAAPEPQPAPVAAAPVVDAPVAEAPPPTLADAAELNAESDYSAFVARGVDSAVRRLAMKKLFADPHFNLMDGLDIYMDDYSLPDPVSPAMLASLDHAQSMFARMEELVDKLAPPDAITSTGEQPVAETPALPTNNQETE
jgi:hypothetical protein